MSTPPPPVYVAPPRESFVVDTAKVIVTVAAVVCTVYAVNAALNHFFGDDAGEGSDS